MDKRDLYERYIIKENLDNYMWDRLFEWKKKQKGGHPHYVDDVYREVLQEMPDEILEWHLSNGQVAVKMPNGTDFLPLEAFVDDLDKEPNLEMLWHCGYHDGPLNGAALYNGKLVWFQCTLEHDGHIKDDPLEGYREYTIHGLNEEEKMDIVFKQMLFGLMVGWHTDHRPEFHKNYTGNQYFNEFYEMSEKWEKRDYSKNPILFCAAYHQFKNYYRPHIDIEEDLG